MIVLYSPDERRLNHLAAAIPGEYRTFATTVREKCLGALPTAQCLVVGLADETETRAAAWLRWRPGRASVPLVVVAPEEAEPVRQVTAAAPAEVVWWHDVRRALGPAISRAIGSTLLERVAKAVDAASGIPGALRAAIAAACRASPPIVSVSGMSKEVGKSDRWLDDCWRRVVPDSTYRLEDFLAWVLLMRASLMAADGASRRDIAKWTGRTERTLDRIADRLVGTTFRGLQAKRSDELTCDSTNDYGSRLVGTNDIVYYDGSDCLMRWDCAYADGTQTRHFGSGSDGGPKQT